MHEPKPMRVPTFFLSDLHLGTRGCQAEKLLDSLRDREPDLVYLVGDIVDGWQLKSGWYRPQSHNDVVQKLLRKARRGARMIYAPGNHDEFMWDFDGAHFGGIAVVEKTIHEAAGGRRYLIIHGDPFDVLIRHAVIRRFDGLLYVNCGDWVESCTAIVETYAGEFQLIRWADEVNARRVVQVKTPVELEAAA